MSDLIIGFISNFITKFNTYAEGNPIIAAALSLWGLGVLSYFGRNIPKIIWASIVKQTTTTMYLMSSSQSFHNFLMWFSEKGYSDKVRNIKISSGRWGDDTAVKSIGYGTHYFIHNYVPFKINMTKVDNTNSNMERDELKITILGRTHKFFTFLFKEIEENLRKDKQELQIYKFHKDYWHKTVSQPKRPMTTIFLGPTIKKTVLDHIDMFMAKEEWYMENGIPYQTGILLYGYPGCGKTSFIKAIASIYNKELYILNSSNLVYIEKAVMDLPEKSIFLIEDIDTDLATHAREDGSEKMSIRSFLTANLSDILNSLDGIVSVHGRILIATTNYIDKLDTALLRNGRFDLKIKMNYASNFVVEIFFKRYYPSFIIDSNFMIKDKIAACDIQNLILKNLNNPEAVLTELRI